MELSTEFLQVIDGRALALGIGRLDLLQHPFRPGAAGILGAPDLDRLYTCARMEAFDRVEKRIDGDVRDALHLPLEHLAVRTQRVGKNSQLAAAVAAYCLDRLVERQRIETDGVEGIPALGGQVPA